MSEKANPEHFFEGKYLPAGTAIYNNDKTALINNLKSSNTNVNEVGKGGKSGKPSFLMYAVMIEKPEMVELLLNMGANANQVSELAFQNMKLKDRAGNEVKLHKINPLQWATSSIKDDTAYDIISSLLKHEAAINGFGNYYSSPLTNALMSHDGTKMFDFLLKKGADINAYGDKSGTTPLITSAMTGDFSRITHILDKGADPTVITFSGWDLMWDVQRALTKGADSSKPKYEQLKSRLVTQYGMTYPAIPNKARGAALRDSVYKTIGIAK